jgi:multidrug transporter EmrE-like cation transporter
MAFTFAILTAVASQLLLKKGISAFIFQGFSLSGIVSLIKHVITNAFLVGGVLFYGISFLLWLVVLTKTKLSFAYPITSINFVLVLIASYYLFGEKLAYLQYFGIMLIIVGVIVLSRG